MTKTFTKQIKCCKGCPNIIWEKTGWFNSYYCRGVLDIQPAIYNVRQATKYKNLNSLDIENSIPTWCPL